MRQFQDKIIFKRRLYSRFVVFLLIILIIFLAKGAIRMFFKERESARLQKITEERFLEITKRRNFLSKEIENLSSPYGVEAELRKRFNVSKPGEKLILVVDEEKEEKEEKPQNFWDRFLRFFQ